MKVVVLGGYGNFGTRICRALAGDPAIELVRPAAGAIRPLAAIAGALVLYALMVGRAFFAPA